MSGQRKVIQSENALKNESQEKLAAELLNANEEAIDDEAGEYEGKKPEKTKK